MSRLTRILLRKLTLSPLAVRAYDRIFPVTTLGQRGERAAERLLLSQGMVVIARGYQDKFGEIDLIAIDDQTLVFVEVKTRTSDAGGQPAEAVDEKKQLHLTRTAKGYLKWNRLTQVKTRFDVIGILWPCKSESPRIKHYINAFEPVGKFQLMG
ncbi:MAG: putative endonuclease [Mariniblastus sp.]|jgi:putative endonuclease